MANQFFGDFLVEKGLVSQDALVAALVEQITTQPPVCKILFETGMLTAAQMIEIFRYQQSHQVEFARACVDLGLWQTHFDAELRNRIEKVRKPIEKILVEKSQIDLKTLTQTLDEFLYQVSNEPAPDVSLKVVPSGSAAPTPVASLKPPESSVGASAIVDFSIKEYSDTEVDLLEESFVESTYAQVKNLSDFLVRSQTVDSSILVSLLEELFKSLHKLDGLTKMYKFNCLGAVLNVLDKLAAALLKSPKKLDFSTRAEAGRILSVGIDLAWGLRSSIVETRSEKSVLDNQENKDNVTQLITQAQALMSGLGGGN